MGRVEQAIEFFGGQFGTDLRLFTQHGAQVALFGHSALAALFQQVMGVPLDRWGAKSMETNKAIGELVA